MGKRMEQSCRTRCKPLVLALAGAWLAGSAFAADESLFFSDLPVVASVSRLPQRLANAPGAVTVIDREMIRASGVRNFADLLRLVPGFQVTPPNQEGAVVAYHGLSNEEYTPRVQVLIDGRSQYSPLFKSGVNWNLLPVVLENIDRIEVMRGSNAVSFGANAFLGVINIITLDASQTLGWTVSANHGNNGIRDQLVRWGGRTGPVDLRLSYRQLGDEGFQKMFDGSLGWFDPHDSRHAKVFDLRADASLTDRDELQFSLSHAEDVSQFGRPQSSGDPFRDLSQNRSSLSLKWRRTLSADEEVDLRYTHVRDWASVAYLERVSFAQPSGPNAVFFNINNQGGESYGNELEFQHRLALGSGVRAAWGLSSNLSHVESPYMFYQAKEHSRSTHRLFGNSEWRLADDWLVNLGASVEKDSIADWTFNPRVSVNHHLTPQNTLRIVASRAHRTPSLLEAKGDVRKSPPGADRPVDRLFLADPDLEAERIDTLELGYLGDWKDWRASLDVRGFRERVPNRIQIVPAALPPGTPDDRETLIDRFSVFNNTTYPDGRADRSLNLEKVEIQGVETQFRWQPFDGTRLLYNYAYIRTYANLLDESVIADGKGLNTLKISRQTYESAPRESQSAMLIQQLPFGFETTFMYFKSGRVRWLRNSFTNPYERVDWRLAKAFTWGGLSGELAVTTQMANHNMEGRRNTRVAKELHWISLRLDY